MCSELCKDFYVVYQYKFIAGEVGSYCQLVVTFFFLFFFFVFFFFGLTLSNQRQCSASVLFFFYHQSGSTTGQPPLISTTSTTPAVRSFSVCGMQDLIMINVCFIDRFINGIGRLVNRR